MISSTQRAMLALSAEGALSHFMSEHQRLLLQRYFLPNMLSSIKNHWAEKVLEINRRIVGMPHTRQSISDDPVIYLHYQLGQANFYITEKDVGDLTDDTRQHQAFGYANLYGNLKGAELGIIGIQELIENDAILNLEWKPLHYTEMIRKIHPSSPGRADKRTL